MASFGTNTARVVGQALTKEADSITKDELLLVGGPDPWHKPSPIIISDHHANRRAPA